ncbi:MAG: PAS domain-containing protein [Planctomycetes bacterium]|nr:PAS domain-containing protein [Planctomycetota bacterium]
MSTQEHHLKQELLERLGSDPLVFRYLESGALDGMWYWDVQQPKHVWLSPGYKALFGYTDDEVPNDSDWWQQNIHPDDLPLVLDNFKRHFKDPGCPFDQVVRYRHKQGHLVSVRCRGVATRDESGRAVRMLGTHTEVSELNRLVEELQHRKDHLTNLVKSIPDAVITVGVDGVIEDANPASGDVFRTDAKTLIGKPVLSLFPPEVARAIDIDRRNTGGMDFLKGAVLAIDALRSDGEDFRAAVSINAFRTAEGHKFVWLLKDVSPELRHEKERQSLTRALEEKNRELESIIYASSHDLRSPLVNLQGFGRELRHACEEIRGALNGVELTDQQQQKLHSILEARIPEALGFIDASSRKMDQLIRGLLKLSRLGREELHLKVLDMNKLVQDVKNALEFSLREREVEFEVGDLPCCIGDEALLNQVITNLIDNAIKYLDPARRGHIKVYGRARGRQSEYTIEDNGIGIPHGMLEKIFEVFHRLNPQSDVKGEGLGLSIVRRILDRHNGSIRAETSDGIGIKFIVTVPAPRPSEMNNSTKKVHHAGI